MDKNNNNNNNKVRKEGLFTWLTIVADKNTSLPFFEKLFGWTRQGEGDYLELKNSSGKLVGGFTEERDKTKPKKEFPLVNVYIASNNVDEQTEVIKKHGGTVLMEPMDVEGKGRMAIFKDLEGAEFCLWQGKAHPGLEPTPKDIDESHGFPVWFELNTRNVEKSIDFYEKVFGYDHYTKAFGNTNYTTFFKGDEAVGGCIEMTSQWPKTTPAHWMTYYQVNNIDETHKKVTELGGKVCIPPTVIEGMTEKMCMVSDPYGLSFQMMGYLPLKKKQWIQENVNLREKVSRGNLKISQLERKVEKLHDLLKNNKIVYEVEKEEKVEEKPTLKRKLSNTETSEVKINGNHPDEIQDPKKRKLNS